MLIHLLFPPRWKCERYQIYSPAWNYQRIRKSRQNILNNDFKILPGRESKWDESYKTASSYSWWVLWSCSRNIPLVDLRMFPELAKGVWKSGGTKATRVLRTKDWGRKGCTKISAKSPLQNPHMRKFPLDGQRPVNRIRRQQCPAHTGLDAGMFLQADWEASTIN